MSRIVALAFGLLTPLTVWSAIPVTTAPVSDLMTARTHSTPATVEPLNYSRLSAEISGRIEAILVQVGDRVTKDAPLVQLDCRMPHSQLAAAIASRKALLAQRRLARNQLRRAHNLSSGRTISEEEIDRRESEVATLTARLEAQDEAIQQARLTVERCTIKAPFDGVTVARPTGMGTLAVPGTPLIKLIQTQGAEVSARLREQEARELTGHPNALYFSYAGTDHALQLRALLPVVDEHSRTREARLTFTTDAAPPGAAGRLVWEVAHKVLPADLLVRRKDGLGIFLLDEGRARFHPLPNAVEGQPVRIDLPLQSRVILEGRHRLQDGDEVTVANTMK